MTVREMRKKLNLTQREFAEKYNIPLRTIQNWELNKRTPPEYIIAMLEEKVNCPLPTAYSECIEKIKDAILTSDLFKNVDSVYLFGSCARNNIHEYSDIDILLLLKTKITPEIKEKIKELYNCFADYEIEVDLKTYNKDSFENSNSTFATIVKKERRRLL